MIKFILIALMACKGVQEETPIVTATTETTELSVTVKEAPAAVTEASTTPTNTTTVKSTTEAVEVTETTSAK